MLSCTDVCPRPLLTRVICKRANRKCNKKRITSVFSQKRCMGHNVFGCNPIFLFVTNLFTCFPRNCTRLQLLVCAYHTAALFGLHLLLAVKENGKSAFLSCY